MSDLISREATIDAMENTDWYHQNQNGEMVHGANSDEDQAWYKAEDVYGVLERMSSVYPEQKKGTWLPIIETNEFGEPYQAGVHCSRCGHATVYKTNFCPNCGVIMKKENHDTI